MEDCGRASLGEDVRDLAKGPDVVKHDRPVFNLLTKESNAGCDVFHALGRGIPIGELNGREVIAEYDGR